MAKGKVDYLLNASVTLQAVTLILVALQPSFFINKMNTVEKIMLYTSAITFLLGCIFGILYAILKLRAVYLHSKNRPK